MYIKRAAYLVAAVFINLLLLSMISVVADNKKGLETKKYEVINASYLHLMRAKEWQNKVYITQHEFVKKQDKSVGETVSVKIEKVFGEKLDSKNSKEIETIAGNYPKQELTKGNNSTKLRKENDIILSENSTNKLIASTEDNKQEGLQISQANNNSETNRSTFASRGETSAENDNKSSENSNKDSKEKINNKSTEVSSDNKIIVQTEPEIIENPADIGIETKQVRTVRPAYPPLASKLGVEAVVIVRVLIGIDGKVEKVEFVKSAAKLGFDDAVREALKEYQFEPMTYKGRPVKVWSGKMPFKFSLK